MTAAVELNPLEVGHLITHMSESDLLTIALQDGAHCIEFVEQGTDKPFSKASVQLIYDACRERLYWCYCCQQRKPVAEWDRDSAGVELCASCYEEAGLENEHQDGYHSDNPDPKCPMCRSNDGEELSAA